MVLRLPCALGVRIWYSKDILRYVILQKHKLKDVPTWTLGVHRRPLNSIEQHTYTDPPSACSVNCWAGKANSCGPHNVNIPLFVQLHGYISKPTLLRIVYRTWKVTLEQFPVALLMSDHDGHGSPLRPQPCLICSLQRTHSTSGCALALVVWPNEYIPQGNQHCTSYT
jgi:hypothetical protein